MTTPDPAANLLATLQQAVALHQQGQLAQAQALYEAVLRVQPRQADALHLLGVVALQTGNFTAAVELIGQALAVVPDHPDFLLNQAVALRALNRLDEAIVCYDRVIARVPGLAQTHFDKAVLQKAQGRLEAALASYDQALALQPDFADAHNNRGNVLLALQRYDTALIAFDHALALQPVFAGSHLNRGNALLALGRAPEALASYEQALTLQPDLALAHNCRGNALLSLQQYDAALAAFARALALQPELVEAYVLQGNALLALGRAEAALASYDAALQRRPTLVEAHYDRGNALMELQRHAEALAAFDQALALRPGFTEAHIHRGNALHALCRSDEALASYDRALELNPDSPEAHLNRGNALLELQRRTEAIASFDRAIALRPDFARAYNNRGHALREAGDPEVALASLEQARRLAPEFEFLAGNHLLLQLTLCDWRHFARERAQLEADVAAGKAVTPSFPLLIAVDAPALQRRAAEIWVQKKLPPPPDTGTLPRPSRQGRIRIGYFSADFRDHPVAQLTAGIFEQHDRGMFEVIAFAYGPPTRDAVRQRLEKAFDRFIDVTHLSDEEVAQRARAEGIAIAIDLGGYTQNSRPGIFVQRAAPVQASYIGFLGTLGAPWMDYLIADPVLVPPEQRAHYAEKIAYLPWYQANDDRRPVSDRVFTRAELGLPETGVVFASFNNQFKLTPDVFASWMRILVQVPDSVLYLLVNGERARNNLRAAATVQGVAATRLVFAERVPEADYLARYRSIDLFLDTWPCNAGATASDALVMGVPVLTCAGQAFASRIAASVLQALGMPELITTSPQEYEQRAVALARDPAQLAALKQKVAAQRQTAPLFDTPGFTRHLEAAFRAMHARAAEGLAPEDIEVRT